MPNYLKQFMISHSSHFAELAVNLVLRESKADGAVKTSHRAPFYFFLPPKSFAFAPCLAPHAAAFLTRSIARSPIK